jgi:hypothetical protein
MILYVFFVRKELERFGYDVGFVARMQAERKMFFARRREKGSADRPASAF